MEQPEDTVTNLPRPKPLAAQQRGERAPGPTIFEVQNVSIWYSAFKAVTDVSMSIYENEITAFIGSPRGRKTTVLPAVNPLNDLTRGARAGRGPDGRARLGTGPDRDERHRGLDEGTQVAVHHRHRHAQHAAGHAGQRPHRCLLRARQRDERYPHGRARRVRLDQADLRGPARPPHPGLRHRPDGLSRATARTTAQQPAGLPSHSGALRAVTDETSL